MIHHITIDRLKGITGGDGLILQGCGGAPAEWHKGINETLTEAGILKNGGEFKDIYVFEHDGSTNILFPFDKMDSDVLDMGKLAMWRLQTHGNFGGTWHSDYLDNGLGDSIEKQNAEHAEETHPSDMKNDATPIHPFSIYMENAYDPNFRGFSIPLPATAEEMQPFFAEMNITEWREIKIFEVESDIRGLGVKLTDIISDNGLDSSTLDELNYLATRIEGMSETGFQIFAANIEAGRYAGSIAEMINLTFNENLNQFDVFPTFDDHDYGDILVNQFMADEHAIAFNRLKDSENPEDRALIAHIEKLEKHTDLAAFGRTTAKEEGGVFTEQGYLVGGKENLEQIYKGVQDIPAEHFLLSESARAAQRVIKIDDANIAEAIVKLHAVGCKSMTYAADNVKIFLDDHKRLATENTGNHLSNHCILLFNRSDICITPAMEVCKRGSDMNKFALSITEMATKGAGRSDIKIFAVRINNAHSADAEKSGQDLRGDLIELTPHALQAHLTRYTAMPDRVDALHDNGTTKSYDLLQWGQMLQQQDGKSAGLYTLHYSDDALKEAAFKFGTFMGSHEMMSLADSFENYLPTINTLFNYAEASTENTNPFMIRIANEAAREILARGDADVYRLTVDGVVKLNAIEAARPMCFAEHRDLAIKQKDAAGLEKWAAHKVKDIVRQAERAERIQSKNKGEEEL